MSEKKIEATMKPQSQPKFEEILTKMERIERSIVELNGTVRIVTTRLIGQSDAEEVNEVIGDVTGDGKVNICDAVLLFNWVSYQNERGTTYILR